jgi:hypothetical protein
MRVKQIYGDFSRTGAYIYFDEQGGSGYVHTLEKTSSRPHKKYILSALKNGINLVDIDFTRPLSGFFFIREDHPAFNIDVLGEVKYYGSSALAGRIEKPLAKSVMLSIKQD